MKLQRFYMGKEYTQGVLIVAGHMFYTLERPWLNNKKNVSCIPEGRYPIYVFKHYRWGDIIGLKNVPGRTEILFHPGNYVKDTKGCILPGMSCGRGYVNNSSIALQHIVQYRDKDFITIENLVEVS